ncbi:hypothetical protein LUZ61_000723 [Rhynchospora tenuis]|uniref:Uncharacterized protein n=1 Tax=Rhynchospora tenuis TaxID=198213 RepID=A0AAD6EQ33_9POAL|nr:hypothetical protein LUZ61_000723 [Rhynchospora tenuis]
MDVLWSCLLYAHLYSHNHENKTKEAESGCHNCVQVNELVNMWVCEGIFSKMPKAESQHEPKSEYSSNSLSDGDKICRALLSHSLLRKPNSSNYHLSSSSDPSCVVPFSGMEKLAGAIKNISSANLPERWRQSPIWKFQENILDKEWVNTNWISFCDLCFKHSFTVNPTTTTLIFRGCTKLSTILLESLFPLLKNLFVLDLANTFIEQLPVSLCEMTNLRFLSLKGCNRLMSLTADSSSMLSSSLLGPLENLEFLDLGGLSLDTIPDDVGKSKSKLRYLDLSNPSITSLPSFFFRDLSNLTELFFLGCTSLESLPPSLINLCSLETFSLSESRLISLPIETFEQIPKLQVLNLINNRMLQWLPKLAGHAGLKSFTLSGLPRITHLSLRACRSLEIVYLHDLDQLEELDLSTTSIKEFPEWISNLHGLKRLDLLALPELKRIPWHKLDQIPEVLNMDQFKCVGAQIFLKDSRLFSSLTLENCMHFFNKGGLLQSFFILVSSCNKRSKKDDDTGFVDQIKKIKTSYYRDIPLLGSTFKQQFQEKAPLKRHTEISSAKQYLSGLESILNFTESLSAWDDNTISSLTDLIPQYPNLQECKLGRCHLMDSIFNSNSKYQGRRLQTLWAFNLKKMTKMLQDASSFWDRNEFQSLKHVHLENCPRLESIFPGNMILNSLETLIVLNCGNLRTVFYKYERDKPTSDEERFVRLHTVQLYELPKLSHLFDESPPLCMKEWKMLHFRGCWNLQQLPLLEGSRNQKVIVDGEERQCKKLKAGMTDNQICYYDFKSSSCPVASFRERVKNNIFLK